MSENLASTEAALDRLRIDRPSPALPLVLLAAVLTGGIVMAIIQTQPGGMYFADPARLTYWVVASLAAYALMIIVARHQGYRTGVWVNRGGLAKAGVAALVFVAVAVASDIELLPGDLTLRGNLPVLALSTGVLVWAYHERRPGLWILAILLVPLALLANLYDMENVLYRLGMPVFQAADQVVGLGMIAIFLLAAAGVFTLSRRRAGRQAGRRS